MVSALKRGEKSYGVSHDVILDGSVLPHHGCRPRLLSNRKVLLLGVLLFSALNVHLLGPTIMESPTTTTTTVETEKTTPQESCCPSKTPTFVNRGTYVKLVDEKTKVLLVGTPKAGATLSAQLMFRYLNLTETAYAYNKWIHTYRSEVFVKQPGHEPRTCHEVCHSSSDWTCLKLVRSPFDRIVSSYFHVMKTKIKDTFPELRITTATAVASGTSKDDDNHNATTPAAAATKKTYKDATFADFMLALQYRNKTNPRRCPYDDHFMPQADWGAKDGCDDPLFGGGETNSSSGQRYWIPVEAITDGLEQIQSITGIQFNATGLSSSHYVHHHDNNNNNNNNNSSKVSWYRKYVNQLLKDYPNVSSRPPPSTSDYENHSTIPPYEAYFDNTTLNQIFCELFCRDIELYLYSVCHQPWLSLNSLAVQQLCHREHERVNIICGESFLSYQST